MQIPLQAPIIGPPGIPSGKATFDCGHCGVRSLHTRPPDSVHSRTTNSRTIEIKRKNRPSVVTGETKRHIIYRCVNCERDTYFLFQDEIRLHYHSPGGDPEIVIHSPAKVLHQYPVAQTSFPRSVPRSMGEAASETERCLAVEAYNACGVMGRRAIHSICQNKKAVGKDLYAQLEWLKDSRVITPDLWEWTEELRILGRNGAHPEWQDVSPKDAEYAVRFLREIIKYIYILPSERTSRKIKATAKKRKP
jgi:Domain of unknown function (DUF4145)